MTDLRQLAEAATPGPWIAASDWSRYAVLQGKSPYKRVVCSGNQNNTDYHNEQPWSGADRADAAYIAACSPDRILALLDAVDKARCQVAAYDAIQRTPVGEFTGNEILAREAADAALRAALARVDAGGAAT